MGRKLVSSGWVGTTRFLVFPQCIATDIKHNITYSATVITPTETFETDINGWESAMKWVSSTIEKANVKNDESDRDY